MLQILSTRLTAHVKYSDKENSMQVIIYKNDSNGVSVVNPTQEALDLYGIEAITQKAVTQFLTT